MKASLFVCYSLVFALLSGCATQDTSQLRVGMTRDEVIKIMGKPDAAKIEGDFEILDFKTIEWKGPTDSLASDNFINRVKLRNGVVFSNSRFLETPPRIQVMGGILTSMSSGQFKVVSKNKEATKNEVTILSITPETAKPNVSTKFVIRVAYSLLDEEACLCLMFNTKAPKSFSGSTMNVIHAGSGVIECTVKTTPKNWPSGEQFAVWVTMFTDKKALAKGAKDISLVQRQ